MDISSSAIAAVKSLMLFVVNEPFDGLAEPECPCRDAFAALDFTFGRRSDTTGPDADGGAFVDGLGAGDCVRDIPGDES